MYTFLTIDMRAGVTFIFILAVASIVVGGVSLVWPRLTSAKRPQGLQQVRDALIKSDIGKQAAEVLGVSDEKNVAPISFPSLAASVANSAVSAVEEQAQRTVTTQIIQQLSKQYEQLPPEQKQQLEQIICKPQ